MASTSATTILQHHISGQRQINQQPRLLMLHPAFTNLTQSMPATLSAAQTYTLHQYIQYICQEIISRCMSN